MVYLMIFIQEIGEMPLPPYIHEKLEDKDRYQTVYAKEKGSAAAPTAGLHFTPELLEKIKAKGVELEFVTLHVGLGTFRPVSVETIEDHDMHSEFYSVSEDTARRINEAKSKGKRIIAVGTIHRFAPWNQPLLMMVYYMPQVGGQKSLSIRAINLRW